jgi:hypothetical protein
VTPVADAAVPCGPVTLSFTHPRYRQSEQSFTATADRPNSFTARLVRPTATLRLASSPAGAQFKVNGRPACVAPCTVSVPQFESVQLQASLPAAAGPRAAHQVWRQTVYVSSPEMQLEAELGSLASLK